MRDISDYMEAAKKEQGFKSDNQLNIALGFKGSTASFWRVGKSVPSDESMIELAKLAGINPLIALADLNIWRASGAAKTYYKEAKKTLEKATLSIALFALMSVNQLETILYIMVNQKDAAARALHKASS